MEKLTLGHGTGGRLTADLIKSFSSQFGEALTGKELEDCSMITSDMAITIDGFTVSPRVFPGGDIGKLAVCGGTNDLAVRGAKPLFLAMSIIAEEGLDQEELLSYGRSAASVCLEIGAKLVAGDTKVVPKGAADGVFITLASVGKTENPLGMSRIETGDKIAVTTSIGRHGATIGALRYDLSVEGLKSDCAALWPLLGPLAKMEGIKAMRDCTRGGLGTALCEWAEGIGKGIEIDESSIPMDQGVLSVCDILGFDPLHLACEGCAIVAYRPDQEDRVLSALRSHPLGIDAAAIGKVVDGHPGMVGMNTASGGMRVVDMPIGEVLPRIC
ncbi:hydrogenase expression/formation protein HypE [Dethiosulfovibrio salsuginis]|uniref:Hydrogenase maturation protein, carbamoyl dehydratase HypE n=1 Tax=Dethiosulfovibrio salsuginis TaxID=561720 RepID=A0A1X7J1D1_9BACT|nr:hydrogenase expression/formation protein HypE [Dethiosulfovibrio salsuginis]SMG21030.1 Hydrogenase maturation protein, carbamoyl dehydratase HypE [Dethiosulfovibrio salsuginis]